MKIKFQNTKGLVEVVNIECSYCGLITNDLTGWECLYNEEYGYWYYVCPKCLVV